MIPNSFVELIRSLKSIKDQLASLTVDEYTLMRKILMGTVMSLDNKEIMKLLEEWKVNIQIQGIYAQAILDIEQEYENLQGISLVDIASYYDTLISLN